MLNDNQSLIHFYYKNCSAGLEIHFLVIVLIAFVVIIFFIKTFYKKQFHVDYIDLNFDAKLLKCTYHLERNYENLEFAHRIYTELVTRKAAIPVEPNKDIIKEIYDSWYVLFGITRGEIKKLTGKSLQSDYCNNLVSMSIDILNIGLRPHLTAHQAKFRKWYYEELAKDESMGKSPQEIQKAYYEYDELMDSIRNVNELLVQYAENLKDFMNKAK